MLCNDSCSNCNYMGEGDFVCAYALECTIENRIPKECPCPEQCDVEGMQEEYNIIDIGNTL